MDSAMVYRDMDIGTAKPSHEVLAQVPHHLIDILDPADTYSAGQFRCDAAAAVEDIQRRGKLPLLVGGTLLYLRALRDGLAPLPKRDEAVRKALDAEAAELGWEALHRRLGSVDPEAARRIAPGDRQRIQRALEVHTLTGQSMTSLQRTQVVNTAVDIVTIALVPEERGQLARRVEQRFDAMVEAGFLEEVQRLKSRSDLRGETPSMRCVGYRQLWAYLDGAYGWEEARRRAIVATRQLAKRQMSWLRSDSSCERLAAFSVGLGDRIRRRIEAWL